MELVVKAFEVAGVAILVLGSLAALVSAAMALPRGDRPRVYERARRDFGRSVLLGLEVLIIADIVLTVTIDPTVESAVTLALIVLVRTFLSFSLEIELDGAVPWRRRDRAERSSPSPKETVDRSPAARQSRPDWRALFTASARVDTPSLR